MGPTALNDQQIASTMHNNVSDKDKAILSHRIALYDQQQGPRVGDFVKVNGTYQRFTHKWDESIQAGASECNVGFYLGDGYISYSGGLNSGAMLNDLKQTDEVKTGAVWFFHENNWVAHNGVEMEMPFRVFELKEGADHSGLYHPYGGKF